MSLIRRRSQRLRNKTSSLPSPSHPPLSTQSPNTITKHQLRKHRLSTIFKTPNRNLPLHLQVTAILESLTAISVTIPRAAVMAVWNRLPRPRPSRTTLQKLLLYGSERSPSHAESARGRWMASFRAANHIVAAGIADTVSDALFPSPMWKRLLSTIPFIYGELYRNVRRRHPTVQAIRRVEEALISFDREKVIAEDIALLCEYSSLPTGYRNSGNFYSICKLMSAAGYAERTLKVGNSKTHRYIPISKDSGSGNGEVKRRKGSGRRRNTRNSSIRKLLMRFFETYGPATVKDFTRWTGLSLSTAKNQLDPLLQKGKLQTILTESGHMIKVPSITVNTSALNTAYASCDAVTGVVLTDFYDPVLMAHSDKTWICDTQKFSKVWTTHGVRPCVLIEGRIRGTWNIIKSKMIVILFPGGDEDLSFLQAAVPAIQQAGKEVMSDFLGRSRGIEVEVQMTM